jgi:hypothetical protein
MVIKSPTGKNSVRKASSHGDKTLFRDGFALGRALFAMPSLREARGYGELRASHDLTGFEENWLYSKKKTYGYRERDEAKRQAFIDQLSTLPPEKIVYLDESGMDSRDEYDYGWNEKGERFHALKSGRRSGGRVNMIAALCN